MQNTYLLRDQDMARNQTLNEFRLDLYAYKILDICWFEGDLPTNPDALFALAINPNWPDHWQFPGSINGIAHLSEEELQFIAGRLKRPAWATETEMASLATLFELILKARAAKRGNSHEP